MSLFRSFTLIIAVVFFSAISASAQVVINEIMYNSPAGPGGDDVEYVELFNAGDAAVPLTGWYLLDDDPGHPRCYLTGSLDAGAYLVVAADLSLFTVQYPGVTNYNPLGFDTSGQGFGLGNGGDTVNLHDVSGVLVDTVTYDDGGDWPSSPDGDGPSLELLHPGLDNDIPGNWDPSLADWGTPGAMNSVYTVDTLPVCRDGERSVALPTGGVAVNVTVEAFDAEGGVTVSLFYDPGLGYYLDLPMHDDGLHGDGAAGDSLFGAAIPAQAHGTAVRYYALAMDGVGQTDTWPNDAPSGHRAYTVGHEPPALLINEIVADNVAGLADEAGEFEDWIEIYNADNVVVDLGGMYLTDDFGESRLWCLPAHALAPGEYLLIWADKDLEQGIWHADLKLSASGEQIALYDTEAHGNTRVAGFVFGPAAPDVAVGYATLDADHPEYLATPTPAGDNAQSALFSPVCINEFQTTSLFGGVDDWIEVYNRGPAAVDIGGWLISDNLDDVARWAFPQGTVLAAGAHLTVYEDVLGFGFSSAGIDDIIMLTAADSTTGMDFLDFGQQIPDYSYGRYPDGGGAWRFCANPTPNQPNADPVGVEEGQPAAGAPVVLTGSFPNPFNPSTVIEFELSEPTEVALRIFDVKGRLVRTLERATLPAGAHAREWRGRDDRGAALPSGVYLARIETAGSADTVKLMMLK